MPLLPNTEVQINYLGGNPDLPYIAAAIENSQSSLIPVTGRNAHVAAISTGGLLSVKAKKSTTRVSFSQFPDGDATLPPVLSDSVINAESTVDSNLPSPPPPLLSMSDFFELDSNGHQLEPPKKLREDDESYDVDLAQGTNYKLNQTVSFSLGNHHRFFFGNQYTEYHLKKPDELFVSNGNAYEIPKKILIESDRCEVEAIISEISKRNTCLEDGKKIEIPPADKLIGNITKYFGNHYRYRDGHIINILCSDEGIHKIFNYGGKYTENQKTVDCGKIDDLGKEFPIHLQPNNDDIVVRTVQDTYRYVDGDFVDVNVGNRYREIKGDVEHKLEGNRKKSLIGQTDDRDTTLTGHANYVLKTPFLSSTLMTPLSIKTFIGAMNKKFTFGVENSVNIGPKISTVAAYRTNLTYGNKSELVSGSKTEAIMGAVVKLIHGAEIKIDKLSISKDDMEIKKQNVSVAKIDAKLDKFNAIVSSAQVEVCNRKLHLLG